MIEEIKLKLKETHTAMRELERACALSPNSVYRWDDSPPSIDKVQRVAEFFDCPIDELCGRTIYMDRYEKSLDKATADLLAFRGEMQTDNLTDDERRIVRAFRMLSDADKVQFLFQILKFSDPKEE